MNQAAHVLNKFVSKSVRSPLSKLCHHAETQHQPGIKTWVFPDGSKLVSMGKAPNRSFKIIDPENTIEHSKRSETLEQALVVYLVRSIRLSPIGRYEERLSDPTRDIGIATARAKAIQREETIESVEIMTLSIERTRKLNSI